MRLPGIISRLGLIIFCGCTFLAANSQSYYYLQAGIPAFQNHAKLHYKIFLTLLRDGSAKARIQFNSAPENKLYLYELSLSDSSLTLTDTLHRYLVSNSEPIPLLENDSGGFIRPRFVFEKKYDSSGNYFVPSSIEIEKEPGVWDTAKLETCYQRSYEDLRHDEPFVSAFYFESDGFYRYLFEDRTRASILPRSERFFLITVANTNDATVGKSAAVDLENVSRLFTNIANNLGITNVISLKIFGDDYSKVAVQGALAALKAQQPHSSDIVIFYFSGHGFRLPGDVSAYPNLSFRTDLNRQKNEVGDYISLEIIYNQIMALKPKVCMVFGDCCNADIYENPVVGSDILRPKGGGTLGDFDTETAKKLFLPALPTSLLVGSVQKDHLSVGNPSLGGYFTHFFTAELEKNLWGYYSTSLFNLADPANTAWLRILLEARKNTYWKAKATQCGKTEIDRCVQQTEIKITPQ